MVPDSMMVSDVGLRSSLTLRGKKNHNLSLELELTSELEVFKRDWKVQARCFKYLSPRKGWRLSDQGMDGVTAHGQPQCLRAHFPAFCGVKKASFINGRLRLWPLYLLQVQEHTCCSLCLLGFLLHVRCPAARQVCRPWKGACMASHSLMPTTVLHVR